jgi:hypothetical protein
MQRRALSNAAPRFEPVCSERSEWVSSLDTSSGQHSWFPALGSTAGKESGWRAKRQRKERERRVKEERNERGRRVNKKRVKGERKQST